MVVPQTASALMSIIAGILLFALTALPQSSESESQKLSKLALDLVKQERWTEAVDAAEQVVRIERNSSAKDYKNTAMALVNLARVKWSAFSKGGFQKGISDTKPQLIGRSSNLTLSTIESHYREAISVYESKLPNDVRGLASVKVELAEFLDPVPELGRADDAKFKSYERLYVEAVAMLEKAYGPGDEMTLRALLRLADSYNGVGELEQSLGAYQRATVALEPRANSKDMLLKSLRASVEIFTAIDELGEAAGLLSKISGITGKQELARQPRLNITGRTKVDYQSKLMMDPGTITRYLKTLKWLQVAVLVDERGSVVEAVAATTTDVNIFKKQVGPLAEREVRSWKFRPMVWNGRHRKVRGVVLFPYFIRA